MSERVVTVRTGRVTNNYGSTYYAMTCYRQTQIDRCTLSTTPKNKNTFATTTFTMTDVTAAENQKISASVLSEVQDTVSRLSGLKGVTAVFILNSNGDIVTASGDATKTGNPKLLSKMIQAAGLYVNSIRGSDETDKTLKSPAAAEGGASVSGDEAGVDTAGTADDTISFVRLRTANDEILVAPKLGYTLVVFQDPTESTL